MNKQEYVVYWTIKDTGVACSELLYTLPSALTLSEAKRKEGHRFVTMASENSDSVGKPGVSDKLPDDYSWSKQHRGGPTTYEFKSIIGGQSNG